MKFLRSGILSFLCVFHLCNSASAQERQLGTWRAFMPYGSSMGVCDAGDKVFSAATNTVFWYDKEYGTVQVYDKVAGLSDLNVKHINYDLNTSVLVITYGSGNIDLVYSGTDIYNLPDIKNENTSGSFGINNVKFYGGRCYVASDIGISVINLTKREIQSTYIIGSGGAQTKVYDVSFDGQYIYAATQEGVKYAPINASNLQDFNTWILFSAGSGIPAKKAKYVESYQQKLYAVIEGSGSDTLYSYNGSVWSKLYYGGDKTITSLNTVNANLYFTVWNDSAGTSGLNGKVLPDGSMSLNVCEGHGRPMGWFESMGNAYEADFWNGLIRNNQQGYIQNIQPDGPFRSSVFDISINNGTVFVAGGGVDDSWGSMYSPAGLYVYENGKWLAKNIYNDPKLNNYLDILTTATSSKKGKSYFGSFYSGLIEYDNALKYVEVYDQSNSILEGAVGDQQRTKISSLAFDEDGNLWIGNAGAVKPIKMIPANGSAWKEFSVPISFSLMKKILIDRNGQLWAPVRRNGEGILVWSNNRTIDNLTDDKARLLLPGKGAGGLPDATVHCIAEDKDGNIWAGTNQGIGIFYCPGSVLSTYGCDADQIKVERDGYIGYLFGTESVRAIAVDAANRKWIGTTNGLWLISADGKTELLKFTDENSPLPTNQITDIAIDDNSGEVFIGTTGGLVSYQGDAMGECSDCESALVYPNPVKPEYDGPIAIKGLVENAYVKITDINGTLVYQGKANGSQMIWNGKRYNGERVKSGVYFVFSSTDLGKEKKVAKIMVNN